MKEKFCVLPRLGLDELSNIKVYRGSTKVVTTDFCDIKKQSNILLFFDALSKKVNGLLVVFIIDYARAKLIYTIVIKDKSYDIIYASEKLKALNVKYMCSENIFVIGDNIYNKKLMDFLEERQVKSVVFVDVFEEGYIGGGLRNYNFKIISTSDKKI